MIFAPIVPIFIIYFIAAILFGLVIFCIIKKQYRRTKNFRRIGIAALLLLAIARPAIPNGNAERVLSNLNVFFVVDNTGSMAAKDSDSGSNYRYQTVARDIKAITNTFAAAKYSIIVLDYNIYQAVPLVSNPSAIYSYADSFKPRSTYRSGDSNLGGLINYATERIQKYNKRYPKRKSIAIFMSDGEDIKERTAFDSKELRNEIAGGAVIGYGTKEGSTIGYIDSDGNVDESMPIRENGENHISKLDEENLEYIAGELKVNYMQRSSSEKKIGVIDSYIDSSQAYERSDEKADSFEDLYWIAILGAIGLLMWDFYAIIATLLLERKAAK